MNTFVTKALLVIGLAASSATTALGHYDPNCPITGNETMAAPCDVETQDAIDALLALENHGTLNEKVYSYCLSSVTTPGQTGLQCRSLTLFYKADGTLIEDIIIDRFIGHQSWRSHTYTTYLVKQGNSSNYHRYVDHLNEGVLRVDQHRTSPSQLLDPNAGTFVSDNAISMTFPAGFPVFSAYYFNDSLGLEYSSATANLGNGVRIYNQLNTPSEQTWDLANAAALASFRAKEGLDHSNVH